MNLQGSVYILRNAKLLILLPCLFHLRTLRYLKINRYEISQLQSITEKSKHVLKKKKIFKTKCRYNQIFINLNKYLPIVRNPIKIKP